MSLSNHSQPSARDLWAQHNVENALRKSYNTFASRLRLGRPLADHEALPPPQELHLPTPPSTDTNPTVCIIGAGAAGLFTALLFDYLNKNVPNFNVQYDIFESAESTTAFPIHGRGVGSRLYTYDFSTTDPHDYYDVGAMRFPENKIMTRYV